MTNAEWMTKNGYKFSDIHLLKQKGEENLAKKENQCCYELNKTVTFLLNGAIVGKASYDNTCLNTFKAWLDMEHKEPILDDAERKYLSTVIKPFRDRVIGIKKLKSTVYKREAIIILFLKQDCCGLPWFDSGTMYRGMEPEHEYTLEELGI